jgi:hypothetical protein
MSAAVPPAPRCRLAPPRSVREGSACSNSDPTCENCNRALPPASPDVRICSYECTFCVACAEALLGNVCPNCGGGFVPRPIRPARNWKNNNYLGADPASTTVKHRPVDLAAHEKFAAEIRLIAPELR